MGKIYQYECKRLLWNHFFFGMAAIFLFYGWQVLQSVTVLGISHTAPFSAWSFGDYLSRMIPLLWIGALFFLTFFTSPKARRAAILTDATPAIPRRYRAARCAAALTGIFLLTFAILALPALITLVPSMLFVLGSGWFLGQFRPWLVYCWMPFPFLCRFLPLPDALGIWNGSFFSEYPLSLGAVDPAFRLPFSVLLPQCFLLISGVLLLFFHAGEKTTETGA